MNASPVLISSYIMTILSAYNREGLECIQSGITNTSRMSAILAACLGAIKNNSPDFEGISDASIYPLMSYDPVSVSDFAEKVTIDKLIYRQELECFVDDLIYQLIEYNPPESDLIKEAIISGGEHYEQTRMSFARMIDSVTPGNLQDAVYKSMTAMHNRYTRGAVNDVAAGCRGIETLYAFELIPLGFLASYLNAVIPVLMFGVSSVNSANIGNFSVQKLLSSRREASCLLGKGVARCRPEMIMPILADEEIDANIRQRIAVKLSVRSFK